MKETHCKESVLTSEELLAMLAAIGHPQRLRIVAELAGGHLELAEDGKAMKYFELAPFELRVTVQDIVAAVRADEEQGGNELKESGR